MMPGAANPALLTGYGIDIISDFAIPGTVPAAHSAPYRPIRIASCQGMLSEQPLYRAEDRHLCFSCPGVAEYRITDHSIDITTPGPPGANVMGLLIATALPGLLWMQGRFVLHAAGLTFGDDNSVIALAGRSGAGKSTISTHLVEHGAMLVGDDTLAIDVDKGMIRASGLPGGLFLGVHPNRNFRSVPPALQSAGGQLAGIVLLDPDLPTGETRRVAAVDAVQALLRNRHRPRIPDLLGKQRHVMEQAVAIARHVQVIAWNPVIEARCWPRDLATWIRERLADTKEC